jgi:hypothetical protein
MSLQDDSRGIRCLGIMYSKFGRSSDARQINFIQPEHACWRLSERGSSREGIPKRNSVELCSANHPVWWVRSRDATVRHYPDEKQNECKYSPFSRRHNVRHFSPEKITGAKSRYHSLSLVLLRYLA